MKHLWIVLYVVRKSYILFEHLAILHKNWQNYFISAAILCHLDNWIYLSLSPALEKLRLTLFCLCIVLLSYCFVNNFSTSRVALL